MDQGLKGFLEKNGLKGTRGPRASGFRGKVFNLGGHGLKGLICQSSLECSKVLGRQVPKAEGDPGLIMRFEFSEGLSE